MLASDPGNSVTVGNTLYRWAWDYVDFVARILVDQSVPIIVTTLFVGMIGLAALRFRSR